MHLMRILRRNRANKSKAIEKLWLRIFQCNGSWVLKFTRYTKSQTRYRRPNSYLNTM